MQVQGVEQAAQPAAGQVVLVPVQVAAREGEGLAPAPAEAEGLGQVAHKTVLHGRPRASTALCRHRRLLAAA